MPHSLQQRRGRLRSGPSAVQFAQSLLDVEAERAQHHHGGTSLVLGTAVAEREHQGGGRPHCLVAGVHYLPHAFVRCSH